MGSNPTPVASDPVGWNNDGSGLQWHAANYDLGGMGYNVRATKYGAVGTGLVSDSNAFSLAANDAHFAPAGGMVIVPPGTYLIDVALPAYSNVVYFVIGATFTGAQAATVAPTINFDKAGNLVAKSVTTVAKGPYVPDASGRAFTANQGDNVDADNIVNGLALPLAQIAQMTIGTTAAPDTTIGPPLRVVRTAKLLGSQLPGTDGSEFNNAITGGIVLDVADEVQGEGIYGWGLTKSTAAAATSHSGDALGGYFQGFSIGSSIHTGIGLFANGFTNSITGHASAIQGDVDNSTGTNHAPASGAVSTTQGIYLTAGGTNRVAVGIELQPSARQFDTGIYFGSAVAGGFTGPTFTADIRSDSTATTSLQINGTHTNAINVGPTAGDITFLGANSLFLTGGGVIRALGANTLFLDTQGAGPVTLRPGAVAEVTVSATGTTHVHAVTISTAAAQFLLTGSGGTRAVRVNNLSLEWLNNAQSAAVMTLTDAGDFLTARGGAFWGHTAVGSQPAAPVTLADVIAIIRGCGLSA